MASGGPDGGRSGPPPGAQFGGILWSYPYYAVGLSLQRTATQVTGGYPRHRTPRPEGMGPWGDRVTGAGSQDPSLGGGGHGIGQLGSHCETAEGSRETVGPNRRAPLPRPTPPPPQRGAQAQPTSRDCGIPGFLRAEGSPLRPPRERRGLSVDGRSPPSLGMRRRGQPGRGVHVCQRPCNRPRCWRLRPGKGPPPPTPGRRGPGGGELAVLGEEGGVGGGAEIVGTCCRGREAAAPWSKT